MDIIKFTREELDQYKLACQTEIDKGFMSFVWKGQLQGVTSATNLIKRLESSPNLSIPYIKG